MKRFCSEEDYTLYLGDMAEVLDSLKPNSIDAIVCDPPYELGFMGKDWDNAGISYRKQTWEKCLRVLKPGGYLLAFGGSRTFHRIACAIEDANFEVRDTIMWLYSSGFPKSMNISKGIEAKEQYGKAGTRQKRKIEQSSDGKEYTVKQTNNGAMGEIYEATRKEYEPKSELAKQWSGWGTCLKPAFEPIIVARKPFNGSLVDNVIKYGVGGMNIDECRVGDEQRTQFSGRSQVKTTVYSEFPQDNAHYEEVCGRFPANVIHDGSEEVCAGFPDSGQGNGKKPYNYAGKEYNNKDTSMFNGDKPQAPSNYNDSGSAARYFYCAKASKKDRDEGLDDFEGKKAGAMMANIADKMQLGAASLNGTPKEIQPKKNMHPTVKPTKLMQYLVRLVTPKGGTVLDPFMGSGSTGKAVMYENKERNANYKFIGVDVTEEYFPIAQARIEFVRKAKND